VTDQSSDLLRAAWRRFNDLHDDLLELALSEGNLDEGAAAALLGHMIGTFSIWDCNCAAIQHRPP